MSPLQRVETHRRGSPKTHWLVMETFYLGTVYTIFLIRASHLRPIFTFWFGKRMGYQTCFTGDFLLSPPTCNPIVD